jgi:predicted aldo/keto reductase-like oxidoreductase
MAVDSGKFETLQVPVNFVADDAEFLIERCRQKGLGFIAMKPFAGGELEDGELALRYFQQFPTVVPIPGIERMEELRQAVAIYNSPRALTEDERSRMAQLKRDLVKVFCRGCGYCMPCPHGLAIPIVLRSTSFVKRMPAAWANRMFARHMPKVDDCIECGECIKKCPYKLPIPEMLRQKRAWYQEWSKTLPPEETQG